MEYGNYGDAAIAFQEGVVTFVMEKFIRGFLTITENLDTEIAFYQFLNEFKNRDKVQKYYINHLDEKKRVDPGLNKFEQCYLKIKDRIRNTQAHFKYEKDETLTVEEMEKWLRYGINSVLAEIERGESLSESEEMGLEKIYQKYVVETKKKMKQTARGRNMLQMEL